MVDSDPLQTFQPHSAHSQHQPRQGWDLRNLPEQPWAEGSWKGWGTKLKVRIIFGNIPGPLCSGKVNNSPDPLTAAQGSSRRSRLHGDVILRGITEGGQDWILARATTMMILPHPEGPRVQISLWRNLSRDNVGCSSSLSVSSPWQDEECRQERAGGW